MLATSQTQEKPVLRLYIRPCSVVKTNILSLLLRPLMANRTASTFLSVVPAAPTPMVSNLLSNGNTEVVEDWVHNEHVMVLLSDLWFVLREDCKDRWCWRRGKQIRCKPIGTSSFSSVSNVTFSQEVVTLSSANNYKDHQNWSLRVYSVEER